jgi:putative transposase
VLRRDNAPNSPAPRWPDRAGERAGLHCIPPGQPWRNGSLESFISRVRDECLNIDMFRSLAQARVVISDWKASRPCPGCYAGGMLWLRRNRLSGS